MPIKRTETHVQPIPDKPHGICQAAFWVNKTQNNSFAELYYQLIHIWLVPQLPANEIGLLWRQVLFPDVVRE
jgi:hypothetical protein